jgi:hypothetical protein
MDEPTASDPAIPVSGTSVSGSSVTRPSVTDRLAVDPPDPDPPTLDGLGLAVDDRVRWRDRKSSRWREGRVVGRERDGSVGVRDERGASRALRADRLEVRDRGPRGGVVWEPVPERAARAEQLGLWGREVPTSDARQR